MDVNELIDPKVPAYELISRLEEALPKAVDYQELEDLAYLFPDYPPNGRISPVGEGLTEDDEALYEAWRKARADVHKRHREVFGECLTRGLRACGYREDAGTKKMRQFVCSESPLLPEIWQHRDYGQLYLTKHRALLPDLIVDRLIEAGSLA